MPDASWLSLRPQILAQGLTSARQTRFHRANGDAERERDVLVAQAVDLAQHDGGALIERQPVQRALQPIAELLLLECAVGPQVQRRWEIAVRRDVRVERDLIVAVPPPPEPMPVARLVDRDAINPGAKTRLATEPMDGAENPEEHLLGEVEGFVAFAEEVDGQL